MKSLLPLVITSVALLQQTRAFVQEIPGTVLTNFDTDPSAVASRVECDGENFYTTCSDCSTVLACIGSIADARNCETLFPGKPYCVNGACSASRSNNGDCRSSSFTCTNSGYFPDPFNCGIYHYCEKVLDPSITYQCPRRYVYNPVTNLCRQATRDTDCVTVSCNPNQLFASYGNSRTYFAYCQYDGYEVSNVYMFRCSQYAVFDGTGCVFECPSEGNFAHLDSRKYYRCYYSRNRLIYSEKQCPRGETFDDVRKVCVNQLGSVDEI